MKYAAIETDRKTIGVVYNEWAESIQDFEDGKGRTLMPVTDADIEQVDEETQQLRDPVQAERNRLDAIHVSRFQAKAALDDAGLLDQVEAYMAGEDVPRRVKLAWQEASFRRGSNMVNQIGSELGLSQEDMDNLFLAAQEIDA